MIKKLIAKGLVTAVCASIALTGFSVSAATNTNPNALSKYFKTVTLTTAVQTDASETFYPGENANNNVWTKELLSTLNIKFNTMWSADATQYNTKLNLAIASGSVPDFYFCDYNTLVNSYQAGLIQPLTEAYNKYASDDLKACENAVPVALQAATFNKQLYALPQSSNSNAVNTDVLWIRNDWLKAVGLSAPKSMADVIKIATAFAKKDPDGDGKADTYGLGIQNGLDTGFTGEIKGFAEGYHAFLGDMWIKDSTGKIAYGAIQPQVKTALQSLQNLFKDGVIDPEFGTKDVNKIVEDVATNKIGMVYGLNWNSFWPCAQTLTAANKNATWSCYPVPSIDSKPAKVGSPFPTTTYFVVSKKCKNPEAIIKIANDFLAKAGVHATQTNLNKFNISADGKVNAYKFNPVAIAPAGREMLQAVAVTEALANPSKAAKILPYYKSSYTSAKAWQDNQDPSGWGNYAFYGPNSSNLIQKTVYTDKNLIVVNLSKGADTPTMTDKATTLKKMEQEAFTRIIMGDPISNFDTFVSNWKKLGGDQITKEMNAKK